MEKIGSAVSFFLGANTPKCFYSLFDELYEPTEGWHLYIIKGGPGTGKSSLMKSIAAECDKRGLYCERIYCSSDPMSLDGVIIPSLKTSVADGTSPHTLEAKFPGVSEYFVDLGEYRNDKALAKHSGRIIEKTLANSAEHKKSVSFLTAAASVNNDIKYIVSKSINAEKLKRFATRLAASELNVSSEGCGKIKKRFLSALTPQGIAAFNDTFDIMCERKIVLEDNFGIASAEILRSLSDCAVENGLDVIVCPCPLSPEDKYEHLIIPSLSLGFFTSNRQHPCSFEADKTVHCLRFSDSSLLKRHRNRLVFDRKASDELIEEALLKLTNAKKYMTRLKPITLRLWILTALPQDVRSL